MDQSSLVMLAVAVFLGLFIAVILCSFIVYKIKNRKACFFLIFLLNKYPGQTPVPAD
jgi:hypothetical protein